MQRLTDFCLSTLRRSSNRVHRAARTYSVHIDFCLTSITGHRCLKAWQTGSVTSVQLYERAEYGVIVSHRPDFIEILLADMSSGVEQRFLLFGGVGNPAELVAALVSSYRFKTPIPGESELLPLLAATGIRHQISPSAKAAPDDEVATLEAIADAVHERRKQRHRASAPK